MASFSASDCVGYCFADFDENLRAGNDFPDEVLEAMGLGDFPWMEYGVAWEMNDEWGMLKGRLILDKLPTDHKFSLDMLS